MRVCLKKNKSVYTLQIPFLHLDTHKNWSASNPRMHCVQLERQLQMQNQMRERQMAMQIAWSREFLKYFGSFFGLVTLGLSMGSVSPVRNIIIYFYMIIFISVICVWSSQSHEEEESCITGSCHSSEFYFGLSDGRGVRHTDSSHERYRGHPDHSKSITFIWRAPSDSLKKLLKSLDIYLVRLVLSNNNSTGSLLRLFNVYAEEAESIMGSESERLEMPNGMPTFESIEKSRRAKSLLSSALEKWSSASH